METLRWMRRNDRCEGGAAGIGAADLSPALGEWFNCNQATGEIISLSLGRRADGLVLHAFGAGEPSPIDWGETPAEPHVSGLRSREVSGFNARYDFGFMTTEIAANIKYGVLVIQSYNAFKDGSGRPAYFTREFFHQVLHRQPTPASVELTEQSIPLPHRMAGDLPDAPTQGDGIARVDLTPLLGSWRNTYRGSKGIERVVLSRNGDDYLFQASGIGSDADWGQVQIIPHAPDVVGRTPAGFLAEYRFDFANLSLAANEAKGLLIIASFMTFRDASGRSSYFTREFFYREPTASGLS
jgi:hypothetical protein